MSFQFTFRHVDVSQSLREYSEEQFQRVGRFLLKESRWHVYYSKGRYDCQVEVVVSGPWGTYKAKDSADDFYLAVDAVAEKLSRQFQKSKEKHQKHSKPDRTREAKLARLNEQLEYDNSPYYKKPA